MKSSFCIDLQRFMLIPTKFPLSPRNSITLRLRTHLQLLSCLPQSVRCDAEGREKRSRVDRELKGYLILDTKKGGSNNEPP